MQSSTEQRLSVVKKCLIRIQSLPKRAISFLPLALVALPIIRVLRRWILIRWGPIVTHHVGHFALNTELYLCERDAHVNQPNGRYIDLLFLPDVPVSNAHLLKMWRRVLRVFPGPPLEAIAWLNDNIARGAAHNIGANSHNDRDVRNLLAKSPPHLSFTDEEEERGRRFLKAVGIPDGAPFVCLNVRDSAYYTSIGESNDRQGFRDSDIRNYVLAAEELINRGAYVFRMGRTVSAPILSSRKELIDYAYKNLGDEFLDIYIGAKCHFCLSSGSGFDAIPAVFRRPVSLVNLLPIEIPASSEGYIVYIGKGHFDRNTGKQLKLKEIVARQLFYGASTERYAASGIRLEENTPEEIRDVAIETFERLNGTWHTNEAAERLQRQFRSILPISARDGVGRSFHGEFCIRYSERYLKENQWWIE